MRNTTKLEGKPLKERVERPAWKQYQEDAAELFRSLGIEATTDATVAGARGTHDIDVLAEFSRWGMRIRWIAECKCWKSRVPKEKVVALYSITQDVGADAGILFSEQGFQSGAIACAKNTNIRLTSLADLRAGIREELWNSSMHVLLRRLSEWESRAGKASSAAEGNLQPLAGVDFDLALSTMGACLFVQRAVNRALLNQYPVTYPAATDCRPLTCGNAEEFVEKVTADVKHIERSVIALERMAELHSDGLADIFQRFSDEVRTLLTLAGPSLTSVSEDDETFETSRFRCLQSMREVGKLAAVVRTRAPDPVRNQLRAVMRCLIEGGSTGVRLPGRKHPLGPPLDANLTSIGYSSEMFPLRVTK